MAFSSDSGGGKPMAEINVTPLVDVMLVLLIIFMITAPLMTHKVKVELPEANLLHREDDKGPHVTPITIAVE
jgi:biopolymer transport protein ExbD